MISHPKLRLAAVAFTLFAVLSGKPSPPAPATALLDRAAASLEDPAAALATFLK